MIIVVAYINILIEGSHDLRNRDFSAPPAPLIHSIGYQARAQDDW